MKPIVVITAVPQEIELLEKALEHSCRITAGGYSYLEGSIGDTPIVLCAGGVGKINAAAATAVMIERCKPRLVINTGSAGAYLGSGLAVGDLVVADEEVLADDGVIVRDGWRDLRYMNLHSVKQGGVSCYNILPLSRSASDKAMHLAGLYGIFLIRGRSATVSTCSGTRRYADELMQRWHALIENMEGAAVAQVCLRSGIDCLEIRGISNMVEERDLKSWDMSRAVEAAQRFVLKYIEDVDKPDNSSIPKAIPEMT